MISPELDSADPTDVAALQRALDASDPDRRLARIGLSQIEIGRHALDALPDAVERITGAGPVVVLMDHTPMLRAGEDLKRLVVARLGRFEVKTCVLGQPGGELHADEQVVAQAQAALVGAGCAVAVGSGTLTDVAKEASRRAGDRPLAVVQTAASVNGFSDNMAVLLLSGVKRTVKSRWPDVLLIDLEILASAPPGMNQAGFGDLLATWTAPVDWRLAGLLGMDPSYHPAPVHLVRARGQRLLDAASTLKQNPRAGLDGLARTLTVSGIAMGIAGASSPQSGTEHLISHLVDMRSSRDGRPLSLHGAQVGVAAVIAAELWAQFIAGFEPAAIDVDSCYPADSGVEARVMRAFAELDPTGAAGAECWRDCQRKLERWRQNRPRFEAALRDWEAHRREFAGALRTPEQLVAALRNAGAVSRLSNLEPPLPVEILRWAIERLPFMRERFTLADLLFYTGRWTDQLVDRVFERAHALGLVG